MHSLQTEASLQRMPWELVLQKLETLLQSGRW